MIARSPYAPQVFPSFEKSRFFTAFQVLLASLLIGLFAQITIPLYFSPVPLTGQTLGVMLVAGFLGPRKGVLSVLLYLLEGLLGLPVFAGGAFGLLPFIGPTGGYLVGFMLQAYIIGKTVEQPRTGLALFLGFSLAIVTQLTLGTLWLSAFVGLKAAPLLGLYPFLPVEVIKALLVSTYLKSRR